MLFFNIPLESLFLFLKKNFIFFLSLIFLNPTNWFSVIDSEISLIFFPFREETFLFELIEEIYLFFLKFSILVKIRILMIFFVLFFLIFHFCSFIKKKLLLLLFISFKILELLLFFWLYAYICNFLCIFFIRSHKWRIRNLKVGLINVFKLSFNSIYKEGTMLTKCWWKRIWCVFDQDIPSLDRKTTWNKLECWNNIG